MHCGIILVVYQTGMYQCTLNGLGMWQMTGKIAKVVRVNLEKYCNISCVWCSLCLVNKFIMVVEGRKLKRKVYYGFYASAGSIQDIERQIITGWEH